MEGRRPQLDLRANGAVGGKPGALFVSPDASQLYVFDQVDPRVSVIGIGRWEIAGTIDLAPAVASVPFFLGGFEGSIFLGGMTGKIAVLGPASRGCRGAIPCGGDACDLGYLPET